MDELFNFEFPPFAITEMDFLRNKEVHRIQQHIAEDKRPRLGIADWYFAIGAPPDWTFVHSDDSCWVFLDQPGVIRNLRTREYQIFPPTSLDDAGFRDWGENVRKYLQLSVTVPSLLCLDYADLLVLLKSSPTQRLIATVVDMSELETLKGASWTQGCFGLLHVAFYAACNSFEEFFEQCRALGATPVADTPVMGSIKVDPRQAEVIFLMAGIGNTPTQTAS
mgnify:FL=1|tara:strand:- start:8551 stop:9216 length:666 start_codon:yes stop_codon:yes gene_type:complete